MSLSKATRAYDPLAEHGAVVRLWVQRSVYENTSSDVVVAGEEHSKLLRYLEDPVTRDSCYREMVARVLDDKTRDGRVLGKVLALLKKHVPHLPPVGHETLLSLDHFLATHETSKSEGVAQTMQFLRALVQHQLQKSAVLHRQLKSREASRLLPANRSALSASLSSFGAMGVFLDGPQPLLGNLWTLAARDQAVPELGLHTRSFFAMINDADGTELFESTAHQLSINVFASPMADRIAIVADYKMQTGLKAARLQVHLNRKRAPPKGVPYDKQPPLELSDTERRKLLYVVINEDACGRERHMMATKVLIKALMDGFVTQPWETAAKAVLQNIYKMVARDDERIRLHALNLLHNLCIQANLCTSSNLFSNKSAPAGKGSRNTTRGTVNLDMEQQKAAAAISSKVAEVHNALWVVTRETLLRLVHLGESGADVWGAALNLLLMQCTDTGKVHPTKVAELDLRVLRVMAQSTEALGDERHALAVRLLFNALFTVAKDRRSASLDMARLSLAEWPINQVIDLYLTARSTETMCNAFFVVYHHIVAKLVAAAPPNSADRIREQAQILNAVLAAQGAPSAFTKVFQHGLSMEEARALAGVISAVKSQSKAKGMTMRNVKVKRQNNKLLSQLDTQFVSDFFTALFKEGADYLALDSELEAYKERMITHPKSLRSLLEALGELLFSEHPADRHNGENWLFDLLVLLLDAAETHGAGEATGAGAVNVKGSPGTNDDDEGEYDDDDDDGPAAGRAPPGGAGAKSVVKGRGKGRGVTAALPTRTGPAGVPKVPPLQSVAGGPAPSAAAAVASPKGVSKEARAMIQKSPRSANLQSDPSLRLRLASPRDGKQPGRVAVPGSPAQPDNVRMPQASPRLKLAGATPAEVASNFAKMQTLVTETHERLLTSPSADVRRAYLAVVRRLVSYGQSEPERAIDMTAQLLNAHTGNLLKRGETHPLILMQMFDLLFDFVASAPLNGGGDGAVAAAEAAAAAEGDDSGGGPGGGGGGGPARNTNYMQFLSGRRRVSLALLARLDMKPLKLLFDTLPSAFESVRVVVLILIAAACNHKANEAHAKQTFHDVGQLAWFKNMLDDTNPQIAYHASRFLSEYLQAQDPVQYQLALKKLLAFIPADKIAIDYFHVLALLGDSTSLTIGPKGARRGQ